MADELIGSVGIAIEGDYSGLQSDFDAAIALAVERGATLGEAIKAALQVPDTTPLEEALKNVAPAFDAAGSAAEAASQQLSLFDQAMHVDYADSTGQLNLFATELEPISGSASDAASGLGSMDSALGTVAGDASSAAEGVQSFSEGVHSAGQEAEGAAEGGISEVAEKLEVLNKAVEAAALYELG